MSRRRPPSQAPEIPGFTIRQLLGSGGFADVFLYQQHMPSRPVAVKVGLGDAHESGALSFEAEANLMAKVSNHPSIVTIHHADIAADARPYLVMEFCPKPSLGVRHRREQIGVAEVLRIAVQISGAVETAHRAGIIHRDIKPGNILVTEYNRPALTDFGISVALNGVATDSPEGMSVPWAPPEVLAMRSEIGVHSDVYSLGATVYSLLAGRSPFEIQGGTNRSADLISRIENLPVPATGRSDVPPSLERVMSIAMAKDPQRRYSSALAFALALQQIQTELRHGATPIDVLDDSICLDNEGDDGGSTAVRSVALIDPDSAGAREDIGVGLPDWDPAVRYEIDAVTGGRSPSATDWRPRGIQQRERVGSGVGLGSPPGISLQRTDRNTVSVRVGDALGDAKIGSRSHRPRGRQVGATVAGFSLVFAAIFGVLALSGGGDPEYLAGVGDATPTVDRSYLPSMTGLSGRAVAEGIEFSWTNPAHEQGDHYLWGYAYADTQVEYEVTSVARVVVKEDLRGKTCISVVLRRGGSSALGGQLSRPTTQCYSSNV